MLEIINIKLFKKLKTILSFKLVSVLVGVKPTNTNVQLKSLLELRTYKKQRSYQTRVDSNDICAPNIQNNFDAIKVLFFNIVITMLYILKFSLTFRYRLSKRKYWYCNSWKGDNYTGSNTEKKPYMPN